MAEATIKDCLIVRLATEGAVVLVPTLLALNSGEFIAAVCP